MTEMFLCKGQERQIACSRLDFRRGKEMETQIEKEDIKEMYGVRKGSVSNIYKPIQITRHFLYLSNFLMFRNKVMK
jgi:hypothetical protein